MRVRVGAKQGDVDQMRYQGHGMPVTRHVGRHRPRERPRVEPFENVRILAHVVGIIPVDEREMTHRRVHERGQHHDREETDERGR